MLSRAAIQIVLLTGLLTISSFSAVFATDANLEDADIRALNICEGVVQLFSRMPDSIWQGYDLSEQPFIYYRPGKWALLFNYRGNPEGFGPYPSNWPEISRSVQYFGGQFGNLSGQIGFDTRVDSLLIAAIPFNDQPFSVEFGFLAHECFHQYQYRNFGDIPWQREEKYPMLDPENTTLAVIEIELLTEALKYSLADDHTECTDMLLKFLTIRELRWDNGGEYLAAYERGKELSEGTAKYVEYKCLTSYPQLNYQSSLADYCKSLSRNIPAMTFQEYLISDMSSRLTDNTISPDNMPRNRIYAVACAQTFLLDYLGIDWRAKAEAAGDEFDFCGLLKQYLKANGFDYRMSVSELKREYRYDTILAKTLEQIEQYENDYRRACDNFMSQSGLLVKISLKSNGVRRSRSSMAKKWLVDKGEIELRENYGIYSLESKKLLLQIKDNGIIEYNDWDNRVKTVTFFIPHINLLLLDDVQLELGDNLDSSFDRIEIETDNFIFRYDSPAN